MAIPYFYLIIIAYYNNEIQINKYNVTISSIHVCMTIFQLVIQMHVTVASFPKVMVIVIRNCQFVLKK